MNHKCSIWLWNCKHKKEYEVIDENIWRNEISVSDSVLNHRGTTEASSCEIFLAVHFHVDTVFVTGRLVPPRSSPGHLTSCLDTCKPQHKLWMHITVRSFISSDLFTNKRGIFFIWEMRRLVKAFQFTFIKTPHNLTEMLALNRNEHNPEVVSYWNNNVESCLSQQAVNKDCLFGTAGLVPRIGFQQLQE